MDFLTILLEELNAYAIWYLIIVPWFGWLFG